jgi:hypothetical protein
MQQDAEVLAVEFLALLLAAQECRLLQQQERLALEQQLRQQVLAILLQLVLRRLSLLQLSWRAPS